MFIVLSIDPPTAIIAPKLQMYEKPKYNSNNIQLILGIAWNSASLPHV
jgi:hypothetical protein